VPDPFVPYAEGFPTPSGRLEFVSARAERAGLGDLPDYRPPAEVADATRAERYPLAMISAASHHSLNTVFGNNAELRRRAGQPRAVLHPVDAAARDLADGDLVSVGNERGGFEALVEVSDRVRPGVVATTKGHWAKFNGGANANAAVDERDADLGGGAVFHDTRVEVTPRHRPLRAAGTPLD
jgi:anaerobic selenocysteine-containing dehydrogenase